MNGWVSIKDALPPEDAGVCAVRLRQGDILTAWPTYWHGASRDFACWTFPHPEDAEATGDVTHWMALPPL